MNFSNVVIAGRLTRDPESRVANTGTPISVSGLAWSAGYGDNKETSFIDIKAFGKRAEFVSKYLTKGSAVIVSGKLKQESWESSDGSKRSKHIIMVDDIQFNSSPKENNIEDTDILI